jgi:hypothetical protein
VYCYSQFIHAIVLPTVCGAGEGGRSLQKRQRVWRPPTATTTPWGSLHPSTVSIATTPSCPTTPGVHRAASASCLASLSPSPRPVVLPRQTVSPGIHAPRPALPVNMPKWPGTDSVPKRHCQCRFGTESVPGHYGMFTRLTTAWLGGNLDLQTITSYYLNAS